MNAIKRTVRSIARWALKEELQKLEASQNEASTMLSKLKSELASGTDYNNRIKKQYKRLDEILGNMDVSVDVHEYAPSWAVVSIQGSKEDYIKFIDLGRAEINEIQRFLHRFDRSKVDARPQISGFIRCNSETKRKSW